MIFEVLEAVPIVAALIILIWCTTVIIRRKAVRKTMGGQLLIVRDAKFIFDVIFGVVFLAVGLFQVIRFYGSEVGIELLFLFWPMYLILLAPVYFVRAFSKIEIYEQGILTRDSMWRWEQTEKVFIKEEGNSVTVRFKLKRNWLNSKKITVSNNEKENVITVLSDVFNL
ncbi:hypothetical protein [Paenibacillus typhae]|uniref:DUF5673 domain-containing protein n=1 Tax=Paenibacillus typhae TaxID=1174501 RepID=A0A1G8XPQ4_9BACL|nr:hypothetical protein [Paenibacillus typhae]SDJ92632.1 hypothetical protein SAMN05216192_12718 [Paenibacillus typhae]